MKYVIKIKQEERTCPKVTISSVDDVAEDKIYINNDGMLDILDNAKEYDTQEDALSESNSRDHIVQPILGINDMFNIIKDECKNSCTDILSTYNYFIYRKKNVKPSTLLPFINCLNFAAIREEYAK